MKKLVFSTKKFTCSESVIAGLRSKFIRLSGNVRFCLRLLVKLAQIKRPVPLEEFAEGEKN
jgi:hypothetical protein